MKRLGTKLILIGNSESDHLILEPLASHSPDWRPVNISVRCGPWTGRYLAQFLAGELPQFGKQIAYFLENLKPTAQLQSAEHYLYLTLARNPQGAVSASGRASQGPGLRTALDFHFLLDPATLPEISRQLTTPDLP